MLAHSSQKSFMGCNGNVCEWIDWTIHGLRAWKRI